MIVSHEHRFVFVEVPRTGSTAISAELRENYGGEAVGAKHATLREAADELGDWLLDYTIIAGSRNPLDSAVSMYFKYRNNHRGVYTNEALYARNGGWISDEALARFRWIADNDADFGAYLLHFFRVVSVPRHRDEQRRARCLLRFESLQDDFASMLRTFAIEPVRPLPEVNKTTGRTRGWESEYDTPAVQARAAAVFGPSMVEQGYDLPASWGSRKPPLLSTIAYRVYSAVGGDTTRPGSRSLLERPAAKLRRTAVR